MALPTDLVRAVREHRLVPFVGAGVSVGVKPGLFPSWAKLLERMAEELDAQAQPEDAQRMRQRVTAEDYLGAAELGLQKLGAYRFNRFLRGIFRQRRPTDIDAGVVEAIWGLRPPLVITTNYDDVLRWAGPPDTEVLANDQEEELALLHEASSEWPWIWHLHGTIQRISTLILAGSDYRALYGDEKERARRYERAIFELNAQLANRPFLYVGFSLSDPYVLQQIADVLRVSKGKGAPSYALLKKGQGDASALWFNYNIQLVEYDDHGAPLAALLRDLGRLAFESPPPSRSMLEAPVSVIAQPPEEATVVPRLALEEELSRTLLRSRRLLLLAPRRGGARTLARAVARPFGERVTWLLPPNVPSCTEAEYFGSLSGDRSIDGFLKLERWLVDRARALGGEHLVVVRHDGGPLEHLATLGNALRRLVEAPSTGKAPRFYVLVAGESSCASLRFNVKSLSLFSGAPARHVPPLTVEEVRAVLARRGADTRLAEDVHRATGGLPGHVQEAIGGAGPLDFDSLTTRLAKSPSVRGAIRMRLAEDDRERLPPAQHARTTLADLLAHKPVRRLDEVEDELQYPEVRLYYNGLVVADPGNGETVFRCEAARIAAERTFALERGET